MGVMALATHHKSQGDKPSPLTLKGLAGLSFQRMVQNHLHVTVGAPRRAPALHTVIYKYSYVQCIYMHVPIATGSELGTNCHYASAPLEPKSPTRPGV